MRIIRLSFDGRYYAPSEATCRALAAMATDAILRQSATSFAVMAAGHKPIPADMLADVRQSSAWRSHKRQTR
jgi:hypothetical protein